LRSLKTKLALVALASTTTIMKTFLLPIDFSPVTDDAIDAAIELASALKGRVVLLHVALPGTGTNDDARTRLAAVAALFAQAGIECRTAIRQGDAAPAILDEARSVRPDFIIMGSHGHGKVYELLVGSTAAGVIKEAACGVILLPPENRAYE
jgi:nucleotide-binding universal stress UspA family protein